MDLRTQLGQKENTSSTVQKTEIRGLENVWNELKSNNVAGNHKESMMNAYFGFNGHAVQL